MLIRLTAILVFLSAGLPTRDCFAQAKSQAFVEAREQGVLYWKKKRYKVAKTSLTKAIRMADGHRDFKTLYYLSLVHHKLLDFGSALTYIDLARSVPAGSDQRKARLLSIKNQIDENYGFVKLVSAPANQVTVGTFKISPLTNFLSKQKRRYVERIRELSETQATQLPKRLYLPYGAYKVSGMHVDLSKESSGTQLEIFLDPSESTTLPLPPQEISEQQDDSGKWWLVGGIGAAVITGVATYLILSNSDAEPGNEFRLSLRN